MKYLGIKGVRTWLIQHLVTLVEDEMLQVRKTQVPITHKRVNTTRGTDDDVRVCILVAEELDVFLNWSSTVEDADLHIGQELGEAVILVPDLVGQLTGVTHDQDGCNTRLRLLVHLLKGGEDEDGGFSETRLGLAENVVSENGLRNGNLLDCRAQCMSERNS
jgi:hypothetical protein